MLKRGPVIELTVAVILALIGLAVGGYYDWRSPVELQSVR